MSRIEMLDPGQAEGEIASLFDAAAAMLGRIPNSYRILAHSPMVAKMLIPFNAVMQRQGAGSILSARIKEMVVIKTSQVNGCAY